MEKITQEDISNSIEILLPGSQMAENKKAVQAIILGFEDGSVSIDSIRKATNGLLRLIMNDISWRDKVFEIMQRFTRSDCKENTVIAITETLIGIPQTSDLIDYWEAVSIVGDILIQGKYHNDFLKTLHNNVLTNVDWKTTWCIIQSIDHYFSSKKKSVKGSDVYQLLLAMIEFGSDYGCSEAVKKLREIIMGDYDLKIKIDEIEYLWERTKNEMLDPDWGSQAHVDDITSNSMHLLGCLIAQEDEAINVLPSPLDELPVEVNNRVIHMITSQYQEERYNKLAGDYKSGSIEDVIVRRNVKKSSDALYYRLQKAS